ncbi:MAG: hypothetical protein HYS60_01855 [Candidatus Wildermuthbacteria bacterium]|nr:hypothetical protein [Candidatus Wildermuthbacteria bacterium]
MKQNNHQRGFAALFLSVLVTSVALAIGGSIFFVTFSNISISRNLTRSAQAQVLSEAGIEDAAYRIKNLLPYSESYSLEAGSSEATITVVSEGNSRTVVARGQEQNRFRSLEAILTVSISGVSFFYGAQVGAGGLDMQENSRIEGAGGATGNVYANGPIEGDNGATITGDAIVAAGGGLSVLEDVIVQGTARADSIKKSKICGNAYYQAIDSSSRNFLDSPSSSVCPLPLTPGTGFGGQPSPPVQAMPISQETIDQWKADVAAGGTIVGNCGDSGNAQCVIQDKQTLSLGPKKITGNLVLTKKQTLVVTGTLYIQGSISMNSGSGATIKCDPSFNDKSCVIVSDNWVHLDNNAMFQGSGQSGSFVMILTILAGCNGGNQQPQCTHHNAAVDIHNNAAGAIFYASNSMINIHNGVTITEVTAYKLAIDNNSIIRYEQGLANIQFSSGPGATFEVASWKEIE